MENHYRARQRACNQECHEFWITSAGEKLTPEQREWSRGVFERATEAENQSIFEVDAQWSYSFPQLETIRRKHGF